jgi:hypothetical protein
VNLNPGAMRESHAQCVKNSRKKDWRKNRFCEFKAFTQTFCVALSLLNKMQIHVDGFGQISKMGNCHPNKRNNN